MSEFTKGPWLYSDAYHETQVDIRDNAGRRLAVVVTDPPLRNKTMEANAHLIAAAPDMYDALEDILENLGEYDGIHDCSGKSCPVCEIHKVLAKAKGETE